MDAVDQLVDSMAAASATDDNHDACTARQHPKFSARYKQSGVAIDVADKQANRRTQNLDRQKRQREEKVAALRQLALDENTFEDAARSRPRDRRNSYANKLMLSEWLVHVPDWQQMNSEWTMVACPEGRRCLIVASKGKSKVYSKSGYFHGQYESVLPGGSRADKTKGIYTLLDCIYSEVDGHYFALDMLCWGAPQFDSEVIIVNQNCFTNETFQCWETSLRFFWLQSKMADLEDKLSVKSKQNELDGLLFYHNDALYTSGQTPLVGWLKPFMLPEILQVQVPNTYLQTQSTAEFIEQFDADQKTKKGNRLKGVGDTEQDVIIDDQ